MAISVHLIPVLQISTQYRNSIYCQSCASVQVRAERGAICAEIQVHSLPGFCIRAPPPPRALICVSLHNNALL
ncbi:hypothetical protein GDO81_017605 [Engystomops pustulosus]|uniref:Uncharacterized protein n=1 Tax=Engystomops pustulosus TaxID=76066 RepID=A0AAV7A0T4_ENGPU|nr:hypothetical protein GDO81_017605 [Engystomops pustulosus]